MFDYPLWYKGVRTGYAAYVPDSWKDDGEQKFAKIVDMYFSNDEDPIIYRISSDGDEIWIKSKYIVRPLEDWEVSDYDTYMDSEKYNL